MKITSNLWILSSQQESIPIGCTVTRLSSERGGHEADCGQTVIIIVLVLVLVLVTIIIFYFSFKTLTKIFPTTSKTNIFLPM